MFLVNNAGIAGPTAGICDVAPDDLRKTLATDVESMFHFARLSVHSMRAAGGGVILNFGSVASRLAFAMRTPYSAAKWGVVGFTKSLAVELGRENIRVNAILPGHVNTPRYRRVAARKAELLGVAAAEVAATMLDAPISGGTTGATAGSLLIFVGGHRTEFEKVLPLLRAVGQNITLMGPIGSGQTTKLINQIIIFCSVVMRGEASGLAARLGVDVEAIPAALAGGRGDAVALQAYWSRLARNDFTSHSTVTSILKDIDLVQEAARKVGAALPLTSLVWEYNQILSNSGHAGEDLTAIMRLIK